MLEDIQSMVARGSKLVEDAKNKFSSHFSTFPFVENFPVNIEFTNDAFRQFCNVWPLLLWKRILNIQTTSAPFDIQWVITCDEFIPFQNKSLLIERIIEMGLNNAYEIIIMYGVIRLYK